MRPNTRPSKNKESACAFRRVAGATAVAAALAVTSACGGPAFHAAHSTLLGEPIGADAQPVAPGQILGGEFLQVRAPDSPGWVLRRESSAQIQFGHPGASAHETYVAMVSFFELPQTASRDAFVALVRSARETDTSSARFAEVRESYEYTGARGYPCVRYAATSLDLKAPGGALPLAEHGLYCRHPKHEGTGFWALYSQRALQTDADFAEQARGFLEGVVVPDH